MLILQLIVSAFVTACALLIEVALFRFACLLAGVQRPSIPRSVGIVLTVFASSQILKVAIAGLVLSAFRFGGFPIWETSLVGVLVLLPFDMVVCSFIHARMASVPYSDGLAVWFVEKIFYGLLLLAFVGLFGLVVFMRR